MTERDLGFDGGKDARKGEKDGLVGVRANPRAGCDPPRPGKVNRLAAGEPRGIRSSSEQHAPRHASTSPPAFKATFTRHDRDYRLFAEHNESINHLPRFIVESTP